jgi:hypothetical protein
VDWQTVYLLELLGWTALLALALFFPVARLIGMVSVRRLQRKTGHPLSEAEISGQMRRARFITLILVIVFAFLFNFNMLGLPGSE